MNEVRDRAKVVLKSIRVMRQIGKFYERGHSKEYNQLLEIGRLYGWVELLVKYILDGEDLDGEDGEGLSE